MSLVSRTRLDYMAISFFDRNLFKRLFPQLDWETSARVKDYVTCPDRAWLYYSARIKGKQLKEKKKEIYTICKNDQRFCDYLEKLGGIRAWCFKKPLRFRTYLALKTFPKVLKTKIILFLIKIKKALKK